MLNRIPPSLRNQRGVSLIELMIALVAGLVVTGAAVALILAIMKSNSETIKGTRLTQELRATADVVAKDLRRARSVRDPIGNIDVTTKVNQCNAITLTTSSVPPNNCVSYGYDCTAGGNGAFRSIGWSNFKVRLVSSSTGTAACPPAAGDAQLSSDAVKITRFQVTNPSTDTYTITLVGRFANDSSATPLIRSYSQTVRIRSSAVN